MAFFFAAAAAMPHAVVQPLLVTFLRLQPSLAHNLCVTRLTRSEMVLRGRGWPVAVALHCAALLASSFAAVSTFCDSVVSKVNKIHST
ncbi:hypothetical protein BD289DRAFT_426126 [Coniella lustricola]|uniref:Uncharacterized protein n=1 Tax=Coniella lustricola TaxID=2025994 RepID=A0A2T3AGM0_9PEZI|nr:hypothetical protein BD289DRAFT_426126 [Coniella lustricola]